MISSDALCALTRSPAQSCNIEHGIAVCGAFDVVIVRAVLLTRDRNDAPHVLRIAPHKVAALDSILDHIRCLRQRMSHLASLMTTSMDGVALGLSR